MTPAERLLAAADLLDKLASEATEGPWVTGGIGDYGWSVYAEDLSKNFSIETEDSEQGKADARYIATMHPEVGRALAEWLRREGLYVQRSEGKAFGGGDLTLPIPEALALADLLLAGGEHS